MASTLTRNATLKPVTNAADRPIIACNLAPELLEALERHPARPRLVPIAQGSPVWAVPDGIEILFTAVIGWKSAPSSAPVGWGRHLRWIQSLSAGVDAFPDWALAVPSFTTGRGITADAIAEYVLAAILAHEKGFFQRPVIRGPEDWTQRTLGEVAGRRLALLGFGAIGKAVAVRAQAFGMHISALTRHSTIPGDTGILQAKDLSDLVSTADHLVVCAPLNSKTQNIIDASILAKAKPGLHLINVSRGGLVDHEALAAALDKQLVSAATLDVTQPEPLPEGHSLYTHPHVRLTPHISWNAPSNIESTVKLLGDNLSAWLEGRPLKNLLTKEKS